MATTVASGVTLSLGLLTCTVSMQSAIEPKTSNTQVCTGLTTTKEHDATKISSVSTCSHCGPVPYDQIKKARKVGDGFVLLEAGDMEVAQGDAAAYKKSAALTAHPADEVEVATVTGDKLYYLVPAPGAEPVYATLLALVDNHPELAFVTQWTPRTAIGIFALKVFNSTLCLQERERAEAIRQAPDVPTTPPEQMLGLAEQLLTLNGIVVPFDAATYADTFEARIAEIVAARTVISIAATATDEIIATPSGTAMDALKAMIDAAAPAKPKRVRVKKAS